MRRRGTRSEREYSADVTAEDQTDDPDPFTDDWAADYESELDRRDNLASEGFSIADAEPELFREYMLTFVWPRISSRKTDLKIAERKGHPSKQQELTETNPWARAAVSSSEPE